MTSSAAGRPIERLSKTEIEALETATRLEARYGQFTPEGILDVAINEHFGGAIAAVSSFGADSAVLLDMIARIDPAGDPYAMLRCAECACEWDAPIDIANVLAREIEGAAEALLDEIHLLAQAYHWSEGAILALGQDRRREILVLQVDAGFRGRDGGQVQRLVLANLWLARPSGRRAGEPDPHIFKLGRNLCGPRIRLRAGRVLWDPLTGGALPPLTKKGAEGSAPRSGPRPRQGLSKLQRETESEELGKLTPRRAAKRRPPDRRA